MSGMDDRWVVFVTVADRSGSLSAMTECFATRGVSFEEATTLDVHGGLGVLAFVFPGSERIARILARTLTRLTVVSDVLLSSVADPAVRGIAHAYVPVEADAWSLLASTGVDTVVSGEGGAVLVTGSLSSVERAIATLRDAGATGLSHSLLRPREDAPG